MTLALAVLLVSTLPLVEGVETVLARRNLSDARVAVAVVDADSGQLLFARDLDAPMAPASNMKLLTTAASVVLLGPDYLFTTRILSASAPDADGVVASDLVLWGSGDPSLRADVLRDEGVTDPAQLLADLIVESGVQRVDGALVLDDGFLDREWVHPEWDPRDLDFDYAAPISALSLHGNSVTIDVDGTRGVARPLVELSTATSGYDLRNELRWAGERGTNLVSLLRPDDGGVLRVRGRVSRDIAPRSYTVPVHDGALFFGRCLRTRLSEHDVTIRGGLERDAGAARALGPAVELARLQTPLALSVLLANKESDNSAADHLFKVMGAEVEGDGSFAGGARAVKRFLSEFVGTPTAGVRLRDGSGLAPTNLVTARAMIDTLVAMNHAPGETRNLFLRTLPVSGRDGTLVERLTKVPYRGAVRAKTGYIQGVSTLSGYVSAASGRVLAFSILINDVPRSLSNRDMKAIQDDICRVLVDW